jgi:hypothetical protein
MGGIRLRCRGIARTLLVFLILTSGAASLGVADRGKLAGANTVPLVKPFPMDFDAGSMAIRALGSCFEVYGHWSTYHYLVALSGSGFKFVYDTTDAYEPLRDLFPLDVLRTASDAAGFRDAHWEMDLPITAVKEIVKREVDKGHPLIAPFLKNDAYHGFFIIAGYDFDTGVFYLQGAFRDSNYVTVPIPESWSGPTASPMGWATNPIFVIGDLVEDRDNVDRGTDKAMVTTAISMLKGGTLAYGMHQGERQYMAPGVHQAAFGLPAYRLLSWDVENRPAVVEQDGKEVANFGLIWRLDAQLGQLNHDRRYAAQAFDYLVSRVAGGKSVEVEQLSANVERTAAEATDLRKIFWDQIPYALNTVDAVAGYVARSNSVVFSFAGRDRLFQDLADRGLKVFRTRWGPVIVSDSPEKRLRAKIMVKSLEARERASMKMMEELVEFIGPDLGIPPPEPRGPALRRRK